MIAMTTHFSDKRIRDKEYLLARRNLSHDNQTEKLIIMCLPLQCSADKHTCTKHSCTHTITKYTCETTE